MKKRKKKGTRKLTPYFYTNRKNSKWRHLRHLYRIRKKKVDRKKYKKSRIFAFPRKSIIPLYNFLLNKNFDQPADFEVNQEKIILQIPKSFSLIENPDSSLEFIRKLFDLCVKYKGSQIYFDHSNCEELEIAASTIMDLLIINLKKFSTIYRWDLHLEGQLSKVVHVNEILQASGLLKHLDVSIAQYDKSKIKCLELIKGGSVNSGISFMSMDTGEAATRITQYFNECLSTMGVEFSEDGNDSISQIVSEVIANCKEHGGDFHQWFALGHYSTTLSSPREEFGKCSIVIFNFGQTIYEGFLLPTSSPDIINSLKAKSDLHMKKGYFLTHRWEEESLWTLYSLQEGISRDRDTSPEKPGRGVGTIKLIESFQRFGNTSTGKNAKMAIISGGTYIYFDGKFRMQKKVMDNLETRMVIAFNENNDLDIPPNPNYVKKLKNFFPGTIITMDFYLERNYLIKFINKRKD